VTEKERKNNNNRQRKVRSYIRREGRFTPAQRSAFKLLWPLYGIDDVSGDWDFVEIFGRKSRVFIELGFGDGRALKTLAARHPGNDYIGIEVHRPGVGRVMHEIHDAGLKNVRVICEDGDEILQKNILQDSLAGISIFFPDPWHKRKHNKRRLIKADFVHMAASRLQSGGKLHLATDWEEYALQMLEILSSEPLLENSGEENAFTERPDSRPLTKYEQRGLRLGHGVWDLVFRRV